MTKMSSAWASAAGAKADTDEYKERFARELSEPVKQRILRPDENKSDANSHAYLCFWPDEEHVTTNVLTAIMQARFCRHGLRMIGYWMSIATADHETPILQDTMFQLHAPECHTFIRLWFVCSSESICSAALSTWRRARGAAAQVPRLRQVQDARTPLSYHQQLHEGCAALQGIGVPPHQVKLSMLEARRMLILLFKMGVKPEALLLPRHPDRGNPRMCCLEGLQALIDVFVERSNYGDISKHKEVGGAARPLTC